VGDDIENSFENQIESEIAKYTFPKLKSQNITLEQSDMPKIEVIIVKSSGKVKRLS